MRKNAEIAERANGDGLDQAQLLRTLVAIRKGDFSVRMPVEWTGTAGKIADALNDVVELNAKLSQELERVSRLVGREGKTSQRVTLGDAGGSWTGCVDSLNGLIVDLTWPTNETARVIGAVAKGDLSQKMALEVDGRPLQGTFQRSAETVNRMVDQLGSFASEVTRVAREVGTDGRLGGQAEDTGTVLRISDNGIGIRPEDHEKIFTLFQRLVGEDEYPGSGVGLAIVRRSVELMGGQVWVESTEEKGSTFCVRLPQGDRNTTRPKGGLKRDVP